MELDENKPSGNGQKLTEDISVSRKSVQDTDTKDEYPKGMKLVAIMVSLMLGTTLMALDATIISVATPKISTQFRALDDVGWYGAAYSMLFTAMTPVSSNFYKYFDPKYVYLGAIMIFEGELFRPKYSLKSLSNHITSWIRNLCSGSDVRVFHRWACHCWYRCSRPSTGCIRYLDLRMLSRKTSSVSWWRRQSLWSLCQPWPSNRRRFDTKVLLAVVFLDVKISLSSTTFDQLADIEQKSADWGRRICLDCFLSFFARY
jgi:hypothetical protein